jgi:hypothetical protein
LSPQIGFCRKRTRERNCPHPMVDILQLKLCNAALKRESIEARNPYFIGHRCGFRSLLCCGLSFLGHFFSSKFVNVSPDIVLSKSMLPLAESAVVRVQQSSGFECADVRLPQRHIFWSSLFINPGVKHNFCYRRVPREKRIKRKSIAIIDLV